MRLVCVGSFLSFLFMGICLSAEANSLQNASKASDITKNRFLERKPQEKNMVKRGKEPVKRRNKTLHFANEKTNYRYYISYPSTGIRSVDEQIQPWAKLQATIFSQRMNEIVDDSLMFSFQVLYTINLNLEYAIPIVFYKTTKIDGLFSETEITTFVYDATNAKILKLEDIFKNPQGLLEYLSSSAYRYFSETPWARESITDLLVGVTPMKENFSSFSLIEDGIVFYFPDNQLTKLEIGPQSFFVPLDALRKFSPQYHYWLPRKKQDK